MAGQSDVAGDSLDLPDVPGAQVTQHPHEQVPARARLARHIRQKYGLLIQRSERVTAGARQVRPRSVDQVPQHFVAPPHHEPTGSEVVAQLLEPFAGLPESLRPVRHHGLKLRQHTHLAR